MGSFKRRTKVDTTIPSCSLADMAFLLLIFFMVSTAFKTEEGLKIVLPQAEMTKKIQRRQDIRHVWVNRPGVISVDDLPVSPYQMAQFLNKELQSNPTMVVGLRADSDAPYSVVNEILENCRLAGAYRVQFATMKEKP
ncbi:MAG: biopolymer transporter ExbD [Candidatus Eisenbacteria bacterium]|jgi:biopolymer transport protein ExbD|nr:biopolymer transporter ExbD [Candidatus Eisenbacteria bacterium]